MITSRVLWQTAKVKPQMADAKLFRKLVKFEAASGKSVELEAVFEDSLSSGSKLGTVVGFHGSPGSHNDFKYIREQLDGLGVRFIGVNYPGFTNTDGYPDQQHTNVERQNYTNALLDELRISGKMIYMGHSRGSENALQSAVERRGDGLVMVNPIGLRIHKGIRPMYRLQAIKSLYNVLPKSWGDSMMLALYKALKFKISTGEEAINALTSMTLVSLAGQLEYIEKTNQMEIKKLITFAGRDHLMEQEIIFESLEKHKGLRHFNFEEPPTENEQEKVLEEFKQNRRGASVFVASDSHFQNKLEAELIAKSCRAILEEEVKNKL